MPDIRELLPASETSILALDLETQGTDFSDPASRIVGIGLADQHGCFFLDWDGIEDPAREYLYEQLRARPLTAFNVLFDGGFLWAKAGLGWLNWSMCSFGLFRQLATEGHEGQTWKLEALQRDVLGWDVSNKRGIETALARHKLTKADMWRLRDLEFQEFGLYCALDAEAALQGFEELANTVTELGRHGDLLRDYHTKDWMTEVKLLIEQQLRGILIDVPKLQIYRDTLAATIDAGLTEFLAHPEIAPVVTEYNAAQVAELVGAEPPRFNKDGVTQAARWEKWSNKVGRAKQTNYFNPGSTKMLGWLFYDKLGYPVKKWTDSGGRSTDKEVLPFLGPGGKMLSATKKKVKELSYVDACLAKQREDILHAQCKSIGTLTGRLSGGYDNE